MHCMTLVVLCFHSYFYLHKGEVFLKQIIKSVSPGNEKQKKARDKVLVSARENNPTMSLDNSNSDWAMQENLPKL